MAFAARAALPDPATASAEQKTRAAQTVVELVAAAESEVARSEFLAEAANHLRLAPAALQRDFETYRNRQARQNASRPAPPASAAAAAPAAAPAPTGTHSPEHHLLIVCLHYESLGKPMSLALPHHWLDSAHTAGRLLNRFLGEFEHDTWPGREHLDALLETPEEKTLAASLLFDRPAIDDPVKVANEGLRQLRQRALEPRLRQIELALANPAADSNPDPISLLKERSEIQRQLRQPLQLPVAV
jgi:DNA primase